ncbi:hypothetical protein Blastoid_59 [Bacillus phage Blastoid]|uniref:Uncharacterized protein n=1 Tax=Bacillus phage Blastoid TaxID=2880540 RepID=U5PWM4_9CAUD|nr:hypothetical protein V456_gp59 [Bacillus phage Blastoid]AGY46858.1 hypothetical protein Blastoid_59 [Bacillus phage Blastoid]
MSHTVAILIIMFVVVNTLWWGSRVIDSIFDRFENKGGKKK